MFGMFVAPDDAGLRASTSTNVRVPCKPHHSNQSARSRQTLQRPCTTLALDVLHYKTLACRRPPGSSCTLTAALSQLHFTDTSSLPSLSHLSTSAPHPQHGIPLSEQTEEQCRAGEVDEGSHAPAERGAEAKSKGQNPQCAVQLNTGLTRTAS